MLAARSHIGSTAQDDPRKHQERSRRDNSSIPDRRVGILKMVPRSQGAHASYLMSKPSLRKHALCASIKSTQAGSPFFTTHLLGFARLSASPLAKPCGMNCEIFQRDAGTCKVGGCVSRSWEEEAKGWPLLVALGLCVATRAAHLLARVPASLWAS